MSGARIFAIKNPYTAKINENHALFEGVLQLVDLLAFYDCSLFI